MQLVGNSHISVFSNGCVRVDMPNETVHTHWVGALEVDHFFSDHPAAKKVRELFRAESGWKLLMLGNHDLFHIALRSSEVGLTAALDQMLERYHVVFEEFAALGRFGWLVGVQQADNVLLPGFTADGLLALSRQFVGSLTAWCTARGVAVVNPLPHLLGENGRPDSRWLQSDGLHLKPDAARYYFQAIAQETGVVLAPRHASGAAFEPESEHESYCALVVGELALPPSRSDSGALVPRVLQFARTRLAERGIELELGADDDFVGSGLFDSLDLVEVYTFATEARGEELDFDVSLRELDTVAKLCVYLERRSPRPAQASLVFDDFVCSMRSEGKEAEDADVRIARMGAEHLNRLAEAIATSLGGERYGFPLYWLALAAHELGSTDRGVRWLDEAGAPTCAFPVSTERLQRARDRWSDVRTPGGTLPHARAFNIVSDAEDIDALQAILRCYLMTFGPQDDAALHVFANQRVDFVTHAVLDEVAAVGLAPESIADVCVHALALSTDHAAAANLCIGRGAPERAAREASRPWVPNAAALWVRNT